MSSNDAGYRPTMSSRPETSGGGAHVRDTLGNFALIGAGGYIAPRHLAAIRAVGGDLVAAVDPSDSVGVIDSYFPDAHFFTRFERFDAHIADMIRGGSNLDYVSICSPNHLHNEHLHFALNHGADAICEKPLVIDPRDLDELSALERASGKKISTILQLRLHEAVNRLREKFSGINKRHQVDLTYVTSRGRWYHESWKGDEAKSGGVVTNIGIHLFDMLNYLFGPVEHQVAHLHDDKRAAGYLAFKHADVRWFLSIDRNDLPEAVKGKQNTFRAIEIDGEDVEFSDGFTELHSDSYREIVAGRGFSIEDVRPSVELVAGFRFLPLTPGNGERHPLAAQYL